MSIRSNSAKIEAPESTTSQPQPTRRSILSGITAALAFPLISRPSAAAQQPAARRTYKNPLTVDIGDPYVLREPDGAHYYMYGTGGGGANSATAFPTFTSTDLVNWTSAGQTYVRDPADSWCVGTFWAPEVYKVKDRYYMFYSAQWRNNPTNEKENFRIGVAVSDKPTGPFRDIRNQPIFDPGYPIIDADVLFDTDGRAYLYFSRCCYKHPVESELATWAKEKGWYTEIEESWIYGVELKPDFSGVIGEPVLIVKPPASFADVDSLWENRSVLSHAVNRRWTEGPTAFRHESKYYMMYSANSVAGPDYALGYATSDHPLGPYTKAGNNPVAQKNTGLGGDVTTTAHNCVTWSPDGKQMYCLYGARTSQQAANARRRVLFLERMAIDAKGILTVEGPNDTTEQPVPA